MKTFKSLKKHLSLFLVVTMVFSLLPTSVFAAERAIANAANGATISATTAANAATRATPGSVHTFTADGATVEFHLNSSWATGYNAELRIINTGTTPLYE